VAAREYFPWELEFPSIKTAKRAHQRFRLKEAQCMREEDLLFVRLPQEEIAQILKELGFHCLWIPLDQ